jgi:2-succinyl-6-hydroxy-2,4-cyclohexadiene-1-carboxylate synthase
MPAATTLVMVPGFMQPASAWEPVATLLPERYPSAPLEHRAHDYEGRLGEIAEAGEGAALIGYSLGGRLALHAALRHPGRFRALIVVGSSGGLDEPAEQAARRDADDRLAAWMETVSIEEVVRFWERQPPFADQSDALVDDQRPGRLAQEPAQLARLLRTAGQGALGPIWHSLPRLGLPVLTLAGEHDERYRAAAARIADLAPNARAATVEGAGHAAQLQRPEAVAKLAVDFLDQHLG